jgi:peptide/nickel transport system permease protein
MVNWRNFFRRKLNWLGLTIVAVFVLVAVAAPWLAPAEEKAENPAYLEIRVGANKLPLPPTEGTPLGAVPKPAQAIPGVPLGEGRAYQWDVYHTLIWGTRSALYFGLSVTLIAAVIGVLVGALSAYVGGVVEGIIMRITDAFLVFPVIAAVWLLERVIFSRFTSPYGLPIDLTWWQSALINLRIDAIWVALVLFSWMPYARITNASVATLRNAEYVTAARALGAGSMRIIRNHLIPNAIAPSIVLAARDIGAVVILASAFIFIGLNGQMAWAVILVGGRQYILGLGGNPLVYWWVFLPVALAIVLFSFGWNLVGDGLNQTLNPRTS